MNLSGALTGMVWSQHIEPDPAVTPAAQVLGAAKPPGGAVYMVSSVAWARHGVAEAGVHRGDNRLELAGLLGEGRADASARAGRALDAGCVGESEAEVDRAERSTAARGAG